jgi:hypothetical protein
MIYCIEKGVDYIGNNVKIKKEFLKDNAIKTYRKLSYIEKADLELYDFYDSYMGENITDIIKNQLEDFYTITREDMYDIRERKIHPRLKVEIAKKENKRCLEYLSEKSGLRKTDWRNYLRRVDAVNNNLNVAIVLFGRVYFILNIETMEILSTLRKNFPNEFRLIYTLSAEEAMTIAKNYKLLNSIGNYSKLDATQKIKLRSMHKLKQVGKYYYVIRTSIDMVKDSIDDILEEGC